MRVAITGAAGFLGHHLSTGFRARGWDVVPIVRKTTGGLPGEIAMEQWLADPSQLRADVLVHAAAVRHRYGTKATTYREANFDLVERILNAGASSFRRFVYVSSVGVYGFPAQLPIDERTPFAPRTLYSATKVDAERAVKKGAGALGIEHVIVRPTIVYGRGDTNGMLDKMALMIRAGKYRIVGNGENVLHHTHVDDIVEGIFLAASEPRAVGEDFILAGPETTTLAALSKLVAKSVGARLSPIHVPISIARAAATCFDIAAYRGWSIARKEPPINHEKLDVMTVPISFDPAKARAFLGYSPRVGYEEGVRRTLETEARRS